MGRGQQINTPSTGSPAWVEHLPQADYKEALRIDHAESPRVVDYINPEALAWSIFSEALGSSATRRAVKFTPEQRQEFWGLERILARAQLSSGDFEIHMETAPTFADDVEGVTLRPEAAAKVQEDLRDFLSQRRDLGSRTRWLVDYEYRRVLKRLEGAHFAIKNIPTDKLVFPAEAHVANLDKELLSGLSKTRFTPRSPSYQYPQGLVWRVPQGYKVIEGYHRLTAAEDAGVRKVCVVVARP